MKDVGRIIWLEGNAEALLRKIKRVQKYNAQKGRIGREGIFDQIENHIRIDQERRKEMLKEVEKLKNDGTKNGRGKASRLRKEVIKDE